MPGNTVDPADVEVAWFPDESAYRTVKRRTETGTVAGQEFAVEVVESGDLVVWIDEAPMDGESGAGHYEVYDAARHGDEYRSTVPDPDADEG